MIRQDSCIARLHTERQIGAMDLHFARFMQDKANRPSEELALAAALVCRATAEGHVCLNLRQIAGQQLSTGDESAPLVAPDLERWRELLWSSGVVGNPGDHQPLILDRADRLYLHRYWDYEQRLAKQLYARAHQRIDDVDLDRLTLGIQGLFQDSGGKAVDWQKVAATTALLRQLSVISGGPGTGKTTTVTKILVLLRQQPGGNELRIALAAPTGKAASRMQEAVRSAKASLSLPPELAETIPEQASTLHRLLGVRRGEPVFIHHADNPLPVDVLILDEASMVDVALMAKLLDALPASSRLILLGDKDQLASVEAGAVLGDICSGCQGPSPKFADELQTLTGEEGLAIGGGGGLCDSIIVLRHSYRFGAESAIGRLALAVNNGDADSAAALLVSDAEKNAIVHLHGEKDVARVAAEKYQSFFKLIESDAPVESLFQAMDRFRVLCALKHGPAGAIQMNRRITSYLQQAGLRVEDEWFCGRPVMVTRNDYQQKLYNGDVGIMLPQPGRGGALAVAFQGEDHALRWLAPARLPPHETVFAMTVHKSQGSEFDQVLLHLPAKDTPLLSRELLYTAITRSRKGFILAGPIEVFKMAVQRKLVRNSGLADILARKIHPFATKII
ncbi:MAG: exodeoxyribonuclease V subunit alpha [Pseudomonadota bacterium]